MPRPKERRGLCISGDERGVGVFIPLAYSKMATYVASSL